MVFSVEFACAFLIMAFIYNLAGRGLQNALLLCFNLAFIAFCGSYFLGILLIYALLVHFFALEIYARRSGAIYRLSVLGALAFLGVFKYFADFKAHAFALLESLGFAADFELIFALGLSFYCFGSITYLAHVYHRAAAPAPFLRLLGYLSFFATFIAGPIFRYELFERAWMRRKRLYHQRLIVALLLLALAKKLALAPALYELLNQPLQASAPSYLALFNSCLLYAFHLWADFSAYSDLVSALALMLGIKISRNFAAPLTARSIADFWRRWHMSLSFFIRDFVYIPLNLFLERLFGVRSRNFAIACAAGLVAFFLSGIWHGSGVNFALWGLAHGLLLVLYRCFCKVFSPKLPDFLAAFICYLFTSLCWAFFFLPTDEFLAILQLPHPPANAYDIDVFGLIIAGWSALYLLRGAHYTLARCLAHPLAACAASCLWLYAVFALMPAGVPNFIYASF